jgi:hypothetical protein
MQHIGEWFQGGDQFVSQLRGGKAVTSHADSKTGDLAKLLQEAVDSLL